MQTGIIEMKLISLIFSVFLGPTMTFKLQRKQTAGFAACRSVNITEV